MRHRLLIFCAIIVATFAVTSASTGLAASEIATTPVGNLAIGGYDAVSYRAEDGPLPGNPKHVYYWKGANWQFVTEENREAFRDDPEAYAPIYGGHGAWAVSVGEYLRGDPRIFTISNDTVFLFYSEDTKTKWLDNAKFLKQRADREWLKTLPKMQ